MCFDRAPTESERLIFGKFHRRGVESVAARELVLRSRGATAQLRHVGYVSVCRGAATTRVTTMTTRARKYGRATRKQIMSVLRG